MSRYHQDEATRILGERHAGIVIHDKKLLLIHRIKAGHEYWVFPGGHRRDEESGQQTVVREVYEETGIVVGNPRLTITFPDQNQPNINYYYLCDWVSGAQPHLTGEELAADPKIDFFDPLWVNLDEISNLEILPLFAKSWTIQFTKNLPLL